ncbi:hypothetical protein HMPREF0591_4502 [Mycobacterium parascrofulaceum ATCC BAA-614]|uniref:Uncharacterized protein n=6 Tax=Mycobacterium TaxID=1763 RepID=D5PEL5_9MYCO|nr:hypothetical protein HMPREF0591_4502 [Mycobacterium parascrofulaceum ATCC BAA-614]
MTTKIEFNLRPSAYDQRSSGSPMSDKAPRHKPAERMTAEQLRRAADACRDLDDPTLMAKAWDEPPPPDMQASTNTPRQFGQLQNLSVSDTFDNPLPDVEVAAWEADCPLRSQTPTRASALRNATSQLLLNGRRALEHPGLVVGQVHCERTAQPGRVWCCNRRLVMQPDQQMIEALVNLATNGVLDRIGNRAKRARNCGSGDCTRTILSRGARLSATTPLLRRRIP